MKLKDKIVVVTGGSGLLGSAFLKQLRMDGAIAINADLNAENDLSAFESKIDITKEESIHSFIKAVTDKFGRIDGWINNAYPRTKDWGTALEMEPSSSWKENIDMHLHGYMQCSRIICENMKTNGKGSVINLSSIYGFQGPDFTVYEGTTIKNPFAYAAIKGGVLNFSRYLASYYGPFNVRVNCISPGGIFDDQNEIFVKNYSTKTPMKRMGMPDDIAPSVSFLISDDSKYITGHNLVIDGGWSIV